MTRVWLTTLIALAIARPCWAFELRSLWALDDEGELSPYLEAEVGAVAPLVRSPLDVNGIGGGLRGGAHYIDANKFAHLEVMGVDYTLVWRDHRGRYDSGDFPGMDLIALSAQYRLSAGAHLLYGVALGCSGAMTHSAQSGLCYRLGFALPIIGRTAEDMHAYRRFHLQLETLPLVGAFIADLGEEGFFDNETISTTVHGEVALSGRFMTYGGIFSVDLRMSASYVNQHSIYVRASVDASSFRFWRRLVGFVRMEATLPLRPLQSQTSEPAQRLYENPHLEIMTGIRVYLGTPPSESPGFTREQRQAHRRERRETRRENHRLRMERMRQRRQQRRDARDGELNPPE